MKLINNKNKSNAIKNVAVLGLGKISLELSKNLMNRGVIVSGFTSNEKRREILKKIGVKILDENSFDKVIKNCDSVIITAPPNESGCPIINKYQESLSNVNWIGYLSSTGVYGDHKGRKVCENSYLKPTSKNSILRLNAENIVKDFAQRYKIPLCIFRISGIYGPERNIIQQILSDSFVPIHKKDHFFNRIHEYDIARVLGSAAISSKFTGIINLSDDKPTSQIEVAKYAYKLLRKKLPVIQNYEDVCKSLSPMSRSFWESSRKIDNSLLKKRYGNMIFPTYKEGLKNIYNDCAKILPTKR